MYCPTYHPTGKRWGFDHVWPINLPWIWWFDQYLRTIGGNIQRYLTLPLLKVTWNQFLLKIKHHRTESYTNLYSLTPYTLISSSRGLGTRRDSYMYVQWLFLFSAHFQLVYKDFLDMVVHSGLVLRLKGGTHTNRTTEIRPLGRGAEENGSSPKSSGHLCQTTGGSKVNEIWFNPIATLLMLAHGSRL